MTTGQMREILIQFNHHELKPAACRLHVIAVIKGKRKGEMNCKKGTIQRHRDD